MPTAADSPIEPGTPMPDFALTDVVSDRPKSRLDLAGNNGVLVVFLCRHCPYVVHMRDELVRIATEFASQGLVTVAISSNDPVAYPEDAPDKLREMAIECGFPFPVLFDEDQEVARTFGAECTPDVFLYDSALELFYRGRLDESTPGNGKPVNGADLREAITRLLGGQPPPENPLPSLGCSIKWR